MSVYSQQLVFGTGVLVANRTDISNTTPIQFGALQDVSVSITADLKELYGRQKFAIALAPGKNKITVNAKYAGIRGRAYNDLFFGSSNTSLSNIVQYADSEADSVPGTGAYVITVTNGASFLTDEGVVNAATGQQLVYTNTTPTTANTYTVNSATGVYTFAAANSGVAMLISYTYTSGTGLLIPISNQIMGYGPSFSLVLNQPFDGRQQTMVLNNCKTSKLSLPTKQDDFQITEMDFMASADQTGMIGTLSTNIF